MLMLTQLGYGILLIVLFKRVNFHLACSCVERFKDVKEGANENLAIGREEYFLRIEIQARNSHSFITKSVLLRAMQALATCLST